LTGKKHVNAAAKLSAADADGLPTSAGPSTSASLSALRHQKNRALALKESLISALLAPPSGPLSALLSDTRDNTERRAALTDKERAAEIEELEAREAAEAAAAAQAFKTKSGEIEDDDDEEDKIYNPLRLPLGWDGKPIPFWLYKLHGLGVEYKCEICSDFVYMGRKVFEKHFQESRHAFGMRALGLPNTKHFHEITKIEDAIACKSALTSLSMGTGQGGANFLWFDISVAEKLKQEGKQEMAAASTTEEVEDEEGNVYDKKTYDDLKRQGLI